MPIAWSSEPPHPPLVASRAAAKHSFAPEANTGTLFGRADEFDSSGFECLFQSHKRLGSAWRHVCMLLKALYSPFG
jgi:hypothetical protein